MARKRTRPKIAERVLPKTEPSGALITFVAVLPKPPSVNSLFRNPTARDGKRRGRIKSKSYLDWIAAARVSILAASPPKLAAEYELRIELGRRKGSDLDNYAKGLSDLLVSEKVVGDDSECRRLVIEWADDLRSKECRITLTGRARGVERFARMSAAQFKAQSRTTAKGFSR